MIGNPILLLLVVGPMAAAVIGYLIGRVNKSARDYFADAVTILAFLTMVYFFMTYKEGQPVSLYVPEICGMGLSFKLDGFRIIFASVTAFMWMMTTIFSKEYLAHARNRNRYYFFLLVTFGATMGVFLSDDLFTTFVFFEIMSLASYVCVIHDEKKETMYAGAVYLAVAVIGGMVTLMGLLMLYHAAGIMHLGALVAVFSEIFPGECQMALYCRRLYSLRLWCQSGYVSASYMAADGSSGGTGAGQCVIVRYYYQNRYLWCYCNFIPYLFAQRILGNGHSDVWRDYNDVRRYSGYFFSGS